MTKLLLTFYAYACIYLMIACVMGTETTNNISRNDSFVSDVCSAVNEEWCSLTNEYGTQIGCDIAGLKIPSSGFPPTPKVEMEIWQSIDFNFCPEDISLTISCSARIKIEYLGKKYEEIVTNSIRFPLGFQSTTTLLSCKAMLGPLGLDFICTLGGYNIDITIDLVFTVNILQLYVDIVLNLHNLYPKNILLWRPIAVGLPPKFMDILCFLSEMNRNVNSSKSDNQIVVISKTGANDYCDAMVDTTDNPTTQFPTLQLPFISTDASAVPTMVMNVTNEAKESEVDGKDNRSVYIAVGVCAAVIVVFGICYYLWATANKKRKQTKFTNVSSLL